MSPLVALVILVLVLVINAATLQPYLVVEPLDTQPIFMDLTDQQKNIIAKRLGGAIQIPTISYNSTFQVRNASK